MRKAAEFLRMGLSTFKVHCRDVEYTVIGGRKSYARKNLLEWHAVQPKRIGALRVVARKGVND